MSDILAPRAILERLVSFPTVSRDTNLPLVDWVQDYLEGHGITCHRHYDDAGNKAALMAHVGPEIDGGLVLSGHTDVVPVDGQDWSSDPFTVVERDGRLFGRGTCDMKGFDALAIWALVEAHLRGVARPLQLALSYDEEIGCTGAPPMIAAMQPLMPKASAVIVGEPSMMGVVTGHKGGGGFMTVVHGFEVHSSIMHTGVNAIMWGAKLIEWANERNDENMRNRPSDLAALFDPPFTTLHVGQIEGGTAHNITARTCRFGMDFRVVPGESLGDWKDAYVTRVREIEAQMQAVRPEAGIKLEEMFSVPALRPEQEGAAEAIARLMTGDNQTRVVSYATEAGQFQEAGYSAVVCGPGDIAQAHQPDEYISLAQFEAGHRFMKRMLDKLAE